MNFGVDINVFSMNFPCLPSHPPARPEVTHRASLDLRSGLLQNALALALVGLCWANLFGLFGHYSLGVDFRSNCDHSSDVTARQGRLC